MVTPHPKSADHYEKLGYVLPYENGVLKRKKIRVRVCDLSPSSDFRITKVCDFCGKEVIGQKYSAVLAARKDEKDTCLACSTRRVSIENKHRIQRTRAENRVAAGITLRHFYPDIAEEWHPDLNGDVTPDKVAPKAASKVWWKCSKCSHAWRATVAQRTSCDTWCPVCRESKGERKVREALVSLNVNFQEQITFEGLKGLGGGSLIFDFALLNKGSIVALIEYDGIQHFKPIGKLLPDRVASFNKLRIHDEIKSSWCTQNDIPLLRISYVDFERVSSIVSDFICSLELKEAA